MARADLHHALVLDSEIFRASQVDPALLDPVVRVDGPVPGTARPVTVVRSYQGPQGSYVEHFFLSDGAGTEVYRSPVRRMSLRGEMFEDTVTTEVPDLVLRDAEELRATFVVGGDDVGTIPVFVEAAAGGDPYLAAEEAFAKALQKGAVLWVDVPQPAAPRRLFRRATTVRHQPRPVWYVFEGGMVYVLTGPTEQQVPGLAESSQVELVVRSKEVRSRIAGVPAGVRIVPAGDPRFDEVARVGLSRRLNLRDGDGALERWRSTCTMVELTPHFRPAAAEAREAAAAAAVTASAPATSDGDQSTAGATAALAAAEGPTAAGPAGTAVAAGDGGEAVAAPARPRTDDIHVEAQIDQEVYDALIAEGKSERIARSKAKAAYVRREKARIAAERETAGA